MIKISAQKIHIALLLLALMTLTFFGVQKASASSEAAFFPFSVNSQKPKQTFHFTAPYPGTVTVNSIWTEKAELDLELVSDGSILEKISGPAPLQISYPSTIALEYQIRIGKPSLQTKAEGTVGILVIPSMPKAGGMRTPPSKEPPPIPPPPPEPDPEDMGLLPPITKIIEIAKNGRPTPKVKISPKEKVTIVIKNPANKDQIAYAGNMLLIPLMAEVKPTKYAKSVKWYIDKNGNTKLDKSGKVTSSHNPAGGVDYFEFTTYPENNSDFGEKTIMAEIPGMAVATPVKIEVFFDPTDTSHPPAKRDKTKTPNWFYYWGQTSAGKGFSPEYKDKSPCTAAAVGTYVYGVDKIFLYSTTFDAVCMNRPKGKADQGVDCYAVTLRHEKVHQDELHYWWDSVPGFSTRVVPAECTGTPYEMILSGQISKNTWNKMTGVDSDGDLVPDYIENGLDGCDPEKGISCPRIPTQVIIKASAANPPKKELDVDMNSYRISWKQWTIGDADKEDWSRCGKQWKDRTPCKF